MKNHKVVFIFSGQGSNYIGMGQGLFNYNTVFKASLERSEKIVQQQLGRSLINELYFTDEKKFDDVLMTHPAIVAVEIAMYQVLEDMGVTADYVAGSSLGEFSAGVASGIWNAETAVEASIQQAKALVGKEVKGGMLAVIGQDKITLEQDYLQHGLFLAGDNFEGHFTLSGPVEGLDSFQFELSRRGFQFLRLPVGVPFHSPLLKEAMVSFDDYMNMVPLSKPKPGFISGITGEELERLKKNYFGEVVSLYTNYPKVIQYIEKKGPCLYIDLGPSGTSATFVKYNLEASSDSQILQIMTPFKRELKQLEKLKEIFGTF